MIAPSASPDDRVEELDALRGVALLGVALVNTQTLFRTSVFTYYSRFHTHPGALDVAVDYALGVLVESKAFAVFSLLFGASMAIVVERARARGAPAARLLARRLVSLGAIGAAHMLLWNGDILAAYALAGLLVAPSLALAPRVALGAAVAIGVAHLFPLPLPGLPPPAEMARLGAAAERVYAHGSFAEVFWFRLDETRRHILPLLMGSFPRVVGLLLAGSAAWRLGWLSPASRRSTRTLLLGALGVIVGLSASLVGVAAILGRVRIGRLASSIEALSAVPFALGYTGLLCWAFARPGGRGAMRWFSAPGRMALTNYLAQTLVLTTVFYGYGFGLFGRVSSSVGALISVALFVAQAALSRWWLSRFHYGPVEWLWRAATLGAWPPLRRVRGD